MKTESFSFTIDDSVVAVILDDTTFNVDSIILTVVKNGSTVNQSNGYSDGARNKCVWTLDDTIKSSGITETYSAYAKKNVSNVATVAVAGKPQVDGFSTPGEIWFDFDNHDVNYTVIGMAFGH